MAALHVLPTPTAEEAAAIAVAITVELQRQAVTAAPIDDTLHLWVTASRRAAQRSGMQRGPWRLSGRLPRRSRT